MAPAPDINPDDEDIEDPTDDETSVATGLRNLLKRHKNDAMALCYTLYADNAAQRSKRRQAEDRVKALEKQVPTETSLVLSGTDKELWEAYKALGTPEDLGKVVTERDSLKTTVTEQTYQGLVAEAAEAAGYNPKVLRTLATQDKVTLSVKVVKDAEGVETPVAYAAIEGSEGEKPLTEYAAEKWSLFIPSLTASGSQDTTQAPSGGVQIINQGSTQTRPAKANPSRDYINKKYPVPKK